MNKVLLINANNNVAMTIARGLGIQGVPVDGVGWKDGGVGMFSRHLGNKIWIDNYHQLSGDRLSKIISQTKSKYIMAMGEDVLAHLNTLRGELPPNVKFLFPKQRILERAFDKAITLQFAEKIGIDCPKTYYITSINDLLLHEVRFPVVLKFSRSTGFHLPTKLKFAYRYVFNKVELTHVLSQYVPYAVFPLIQEYVPGKGLGVELCMSNGQIAAAFQHERIHEIGRAHV